MRTNFYKIVLTVVLACICSCTSTESREVKSSGDADLDKTANFLFHCVTQMKKRGSSARPSEIAEYITSANGKAEFIPPSKEVEAEAAAFYAGPRPAENTMYFGDFFEGNFFEKQIVLYGDDERGLIIAEGYSSNDAEEPTFVWEWS